jgi:hypothetical protein
MGRRSLVKQGYNIKKRTNERTIIPLRILWWRKGYPGHYHYKCEGLNPDGDPFEGIGATLEQALEDFQVISETYDQKTINIKNAIRRLVEHRTKCQESLNACTPRERKSVVARHVRAAIRMYSRSIRKYERKLKKKLVGPYSFMFRKPKRGDKIIVPGICRRPNGTYKRKRITRVLKDGSFWAK